MNTSGLRRGGGRPKGVPNKASREVKDLARALFDDTYWEQVRARLLRGKVAPAVEAKLLAYAYGEPKQAHSHEIQGVDNLAAALARKVLFDIQPGPTKAA